MALLSHCNGGLRNDWTSCGLQVTHTWTVWIRRGSPWPLDSGQSSSHCAPWPAYFLEMWSLRAGETAQWLGALALCQRICTLLRHLTTACHSSLRVGLMSSSGLQGYLYTYAQCTAHQNKPSKRNVNSEPSGSDTSRLCVLWSLWCASQEASGPER